MSRALLTPAQREFLRGEKDDVDTDTYRYNVRSDFRERMDELETDLELLRAAGQEDLVEEFHARFGRGDLEQRVNELEDELNAIRQLLDDVAE